MNSNRSFGQFRLHDQAISGRGITAILDYVLDLGFVTKEQVKEAREKQQIMANHGVKHPAWRWLALQHSVDSDQVYRAAAETYGYTPLKASADELTLFVRRIAASFSIDQWRKMGVAGVVPVRRTDVSDIPSHWCFAAIDPTSRPVHAVVRHAVGDEYTIYHAERSLIVSLLIEVYLVTMELPRRWPIC